MKATKWQRTVSLLLCLIMAMGFLIVTAPKAYAADIPQMKTLEVAYVYNSKTPSLACKVKNVSVENFGELQKIPNTTVDAIGMINITVGPPAPCTYDTTTKTPTITGAPVSVDKYPAELVLIAKTYTQVFDMEGVKGTNTALKRMTQSDSNKNLYTFSSPSTSTLITSLTTIIVR